jgi:hypothetical protein
VIALARLNLGHNHLLLLIVYNYSFSSPFEPANESLEFAAHVVVAEDVDGVDVGAIGQLLGDDDIALGDNFAIYSRGLLASDDERYPVVALLWPSE